MLLAVFQYAVSQRSKEYGLYGSHPALFSQVLTKSIFVAIVINAFKSIDLTIPSDNKLPYCGLNDLTSRFWGGFNKVSCWTIYGLSTNYHVVTVASFLPQAKPHAIMFGA